jgi:pimeloyl-ACP methyl ester carboxylesterase
VVDPATAEHHLATLPGARADWWQGSGHVPFAEDPVRFNRALRSFATDCMVDRERMAR